MQISYHPAYDIHHTLFRCLRVAVMLNDDDIRLHYDTLRVLSYYLLFPQMLKDFRFRHDHRKYKSLAKNNIHIPHFERLPQSIEFFARIGPVQRAAVDTLAKNEVVDPYTLSKFEVKFNLKRVPDQIIERVKLRNSNSPEMVKILKVIIENYDLRGENGIRARSGLLEYRYDPI